MFRIFLLAMSSSQSVTICNKSGDPVAFFMPIIPIGSEASLMRLVFAPLACYLLKFTMFILVINFENYRKTHEFHPLVRGSSNTGRTVKILSGHLLVLKLYMCKFAVLCYFYFGLRRVQQVCS